MYRTALATAAPTILALVGLAHAADEPKAGVPMAAPLPFVPVEHGFLIRLPICSWKALPITDETASSFACRASGGSHVACRIENGDPVPPAPVVPGDSYRIHVPKIVEWSDGNAIGGFYQDTIVVGSPRSMGCRYDGRHEQMKAVVLPDLRPSPYSGGARVDTKQVPFDPTERVATTAERIAGLPVARVTGFVNGNVLNPAAETSADSSALMSACRCLGVSSRAFWFRPRDFPDGQPSLDRRQSAEEEE